jgi:hypothetical protein
MPPSKFIALALKQLADVYLHFGDIKRDLSLKTRAADMLFKCDLGNDKDVAMCLKSVSNSFHRNNHIKKALYFGVKAVEMYE